MSNSDLNRPHVFQPGTNNRVLLLLHGTGANEYDPITLGRALDPNASQLSPRGMHLEAGMNRFFERYPDGTFNEDSIDVAVAELSEFITVATEHYGLAGKEVVAVGFSNGANTAAALLVKRPEVLDAAVLFGSTKPYQNPAPADLTGTRIWLANGDQDPYAPVKISEDWVTTLTSFGASVSWLRHSGGHQIYSAHVSEIAKEMNY